MRTADLDREVPTDLAGYRSYLMRVARTRLRDEPGVEDAVHDTLLAALRGKSRFAGLAAYRTWLTGILLHKIHDGFRRAARERAVFADDGGVEGDYFDAAGAWRHPPGEWTDAERALESKRFRTAFALGLSRLPSLQAEAFVLRELAGMDSGDICRTLGITVANLYVLLHRARLSLRSTLECSGFVPENAARAR